MNDGNRRKERGDRPSLIVVAMLLAAWAPLSTYALAGTIAPHVAWLGIAASIGLLCGIGSFVVAAFANGRLSAAILFGVALTATLLAGPFIAVFMVLFTGIGLAGLWSVFGPGNEAVPEYVVRQGIVLLLYAALAALFFLVQAFAILRAWAVWKGR